MPRYYLCRKSFKERGSRIKSQRSALDLRKPFGGLDWFRGTRTSSSEGKCETMLEHLQTSHPNDRFLESAKYINDTSSLPVGVWTVWRSSKGSAQIKWLSCKSFCINFLI